MLMLRGLLSSRTFSQALEEVDLIAYFTGVCSCQRIWEGDSECPCASADANVDTDTDADVDCAGNGEETRGAGLMGV